MTERRSWFWPGWATSVWSAPAPLQTSACPVIEFKTAEDRDRAIRRLKVGLAADVRARLDERERVIGALSADVADLETDRARLLDSLSALVDCARHAQSSDYEAKALETAQDLMDELYEKDVLPNA